MKPGVLFFGTGLSDVIMPSRIAALDTRSELTRLVSRVLRGPSRRFRSLAREAPGQRQLFFPPATIGIAGWCSACLVSLEVCVGDGSALYRRRNGMVRGAMVPATSAAASW